MPWRHSTACSPRAPSPLNDTTAPPRRQGRCKCPSGTLASVLVPWCGGSARAFTRPSPARHCGAVWVRCARGTRAGCAGRRRRHAAAHAQRTVAACGNRLQRQRARVWGSGTAVPQGSAHCGARAERQTRRTAQSGTVHPSASILPLTAAVKGGASALRAPLTASASGIEPPSNPLRTPFEPPLGTAKPAEKTEKPPKRG